MANSWQARTPQWWPHKWRVATAATPSILQDPGKALGLEDLASRGSPDWFYVARNSNGLSLFYKKISKKLFTTLIWIQQPNWPYSWICCVHTKLFCKINSNFLLHFTTTFFKTHSMQWCNENIIHNYWNFNLTIAIFLC